MFQSAGTAIGLNKALYWIAQTPVIVDPVIDSPAEASVAFSGPNFFIALIAGVLLAFAFQLLLTNLGVAIGISALGGGSSDNHSNRNLEEMPESPDEARRQLDDHSSSSSSIGGTIRKITVGLGLATLVSVSLSLFVACWLAISLSLLQAEVGLGVIMGLVIWATYFTLLVWVSSTTVGSLVGSVVNAATSGFQSIIGTATAALGGVAASRQAVSTAEAAARAVRRELTAGLDPVGIRERLEDYLGALRPPELDFGGIQRNIEDLFRDPRFQELTSGDLTHVNRQTFVDLVSARSDLSKKEIDRIVDQLESAWKGAVSKLPSKNRFDEFMDYIKQAAPTQLLGDEFTSKLDDLVQELRLRREGQQGGQQGQDQNQGSGPLSQALTFGMNSIMGQLMGRADLSDFDLQKILGQLQQAKDKVGEQTDKAKAQISGGEAQQYSPVKADVENYLHNAYSWRMTRANLEQEFRDVIYDAEADPGAVAQELEQLDRQYFAEVLRSRGVFTQTRIEEISQELEAIRLEALSAARAAQEQGKAMEVFRAVENYLLTTPKEDLTPEKIGLNFKPILEDPDADYDVLSTRLAQFDRMSFERLLNQREDMTSIEAEAIIPELEKARDRALAEYQEAQEATRAKVEAQWLKVQSYLRDTGKGELNPEGIQRDLQTLLNDPQAGVAALRARASSFDRDSLVQLLSQREELSEEQVNQIIDQVEGVWSRVRSTPGQLAGKAQDQYDNAMSAITDYLRNTGKDELNPEGIQQDLSLLLQNPQLGAQALRMRLAEADRDTLVKLLSQRQDLSEEQVNEVIDSVQSTLRSVARAPRRLATRAQAQVMDFEGTLEDYLRNTGKEELNPEGIKRDLQQLLNDPRSGISSISDRLSRFDRSTMIALLSQREDISEEEVTRIVDQILSVRGQFVEQLQSIQQNIQQSIQSVIDGIFDRIRNYLNSLERPELNYEGITGDIRTLFDDPEAGFEALRMRLGQFDRDTLVAILSSREDISEADVNRVIDQIEGTRNRVLQRAERIQQETQRRIEEFKVEAQRGADETRKAAAAAAWWLFATALVSAIASGLGGLVAVITS